MAAGTITLAHDSGGPKLDILTPYEDKQTGFLASDVDSYADAMKNIFSLPESQSVEICENARKSVVRFSEPEFEAGFLSVMEQFLNTAS